MTEPRNIRPGVTWFVTHRASRRHFLFSPDEEGVVEQIYWWATAIAAKQKGVQVHVVQLMSSHPHEIVTDVNGNLPSFFERRNFLMAQALKVHLGWPGEVFEKLQSCYVELPTAAAVIKEAAYTIVNCVAAGLVRTPQRWPGAKVLADEMGRRIIEVKRPKVYFRPSSWDDEASLELTMPALLEQAYDGDHDACRAAVQAEVDRLVRKAHEDNNNKGMGYAGRKRVLKTPHTKRASSYETFGARKPRFCAAGDPNVAARMVAQHRAFQRAYRDAWNEWVAGNRDVIFPHGTWMMVDKHRARCAPPPPS